MDQFLANKRVVVTGGTRGIGRAIAQSVVDAGASVVICGRKQAEVDRAVGELKRTTGTKVAGTVADVSQDTAVAELFRFADGELGGLDVLVNNAGVGVFKSTAELTVEDWKRTVDTNLSGVFYCSREALARFKIQASAGYVINISSLAGKNPFAGGAAYNASKFGLNGFSEAMMLDHRQDRVKVSYIMPGSVDTDFGSGGTGAEWKIAPQDIADMVLFLLRTPERTLISRIEVRPSQPRK